MSKLIIRWFINALGLYLAIGTDWISGIDAEDTSIVAILALAFVFGVINVFVRPLLKLLTCPVILLTLGLFTLVINAVLFWLTGLIGSLFNIGYTSRWSSKFGVDRIIPRGTEKRSKLGPF
jgi:putative membrane protein